MQICPKKNEDVFQQLYQYDFFAVSTDKKYSKRPRVSTERFKNIGEKFAKYINLFIQVWSRRLLCLFYS